MSQVNDQCQFVKTKNGKDGLIKVQLVGVDVNEPPRYRLFARSRELKNNCESWKCQQCRSMKEAKDGDATIKIPIIKIRKVDTELFFASDPNQAMHACASMSEDQVMGLSMKRKLVQGMVNSDRTPREEYNTMHLDMVRDQGQAFALRMESHLPQYRGVQSSLYASKAKNIPVIRTLDDIPMFLKLTFGDRSDENIEIANHIPYLIYTRQIPQIPYVESKWKNIFIFASQLDLEVNN